MPRLTFSHILVLSALVRGALVIYSEYHDSHSLVKYTDVDYRVFTDAARFLLDPAQDGGRQAQGWLGMHVGDPYMRDTYRYTPLLALLMIPNRLLHSSFGKMVFSLCDLLIGTMLYKMFFSFPPVLVTNPSEIERKATLWVSALWLLNPLVFSISTRGSSESVLGLLVVGTLYFILKGERIQAAMLFGLSVHWKIYPIIYAASILAFYGTQTRHNKSVPSNWFLRMASPRGIAFGMLSVTSFIGVTSALYLIWGYPLLWHSYLYHLGRLDHRHNFSPYFYPTYLSYPSLGQKGHAQVFSAASQPLLSFVPQMVLALGAGFLLGGEDLPFAWFVQTMIFVTFNKVCTSQYFIWYIWFLPLILPRLHLSVREGLMIIVVWIGAQALWLSVAYRLEFLGNQVYLSLWCSSVVLFVSNCWILDKMMRAYAN